LHFGFDHQDNHLVANGAEQATTVRGNACARVTRRGFDRAAPPVLSLGIG